jgi:hypothetical protein
MCCRLQRCREEEDDMAQSRGLVVVRVDTDPITHEEKVFPTGVCGVSPEDAEAIILNYEVQKSPNVAFRAITPEQFSQLMSLNNG